MKYLIKKFRAISLNFCLVKLNLHKIWGLIYEQFILLYSKIAWVLKTSKHSFEL